MGSETRVDRQPSPIASPLGYHDRGMAVINKQSITSFEFVIMLFEYHISH